VSSDSKDVLWSTVQDGITNIVSSELVEHRPHRSASHPSNADQLVFISNEGIHLYECKDTAKTYSSRSHITGRQGTLSPVSSLPYALCARPFSRGHFQRITGISLSTQKASTAKSDGLVRSVYITHSSFKKSGSRRPSQIFDRSIWTETRVSSQRWLNLLNRFGYT